MKEFLRSGDEIGEPTRLGEALTIVGHHFGEPLDNQALLNMAMQFGLPESESENVARAIAATGFTWRYASHFPGKELDLPKALDRVTDIGALLLKNAMKAQKWDSVDVFIDTSAFLPENINKEVLEKAGLSPHKVVSKSYRYACAGAVGAFIDVVSDPSFKDARVVIGALEPLTWLIDRSQFMTPSGVAFPSIFGDAFTFMAFSPGRFEFTNKQILIKPDGGVIKLNSLYNFEATESVPASIPSYYKFAEGGEGIFHFSDKGAYLNIQPPASPHAVSMDGIATGMFFGDNTTKVLTGLMQEYGDTNLLRKLGDKNLIMHPASKPVVDRIAKLMKRGGYLDTPEIPFLMDKAKYSNGSSATTLNRLRYMIENNLIDPGKPVVWLAPGIGSAIAGAIGTINP